MMTEIEKKNNSFDLTNFRKFRDWLKEYTMGDIWNKNVIGARPRNNDELRIEGDE